MHSMPVAFSSIHIKNQSPSRRNFNFNNMFYSLRSSIVRWALHSAIQLYLRLLFYISLLLLAQTVQFIRLQRLISTELSYRRSCNSALARDEANAIFFSFLVFSSRLAAPLFFPLYHWLLILFPFWPKINCH